MERRDDIGGKIVISIMASIILLMFGSFLNVAWSTASDGKKKADAVEIKQISMEAKFDAFQGDLTEIKDLLKRKIPGG